MPVSQPNVPSVALSTTETDTVIQEIAEYAAKYTHKAKGSQKRRRVLVWRESVGFEEYGVFTKVDGVKSQVEILDSSVTNTTVERIEDPALVTEETGRNLTSHINQRI